MFQLQSLLLNRKKTANLRWKFIEKRVAWKSKKKAGTDFILHFQINYYHLTSVLWQPE